MIIDFVAAAAAARLTTVIVLKHVPLPIHEEQEQNLKHADAEYAEQ